MKKPDSPHSITKTTFKGLAVILPVFILGLIVYWLLHTVESGLGRVFRFIFPDEFYFPGLGLILAAIISYVVGVVMSVTIAQRLLAAWNRLLERLPFVKTIYGALEDIVASFSTDKTKRFNRVVLVTFDNLGVKLLGYVTRDDLSYLPQGFGGTDEILVYLPMSYQIGGYMVVVPRSHVTPVDISVEDASRLVLTAGMSVSSRSSI